MLCEEESNVLIETDEQAYEFARVQPGMGLSLLIYLLGDKGRLNRLKYAALAETGMESVGKAHKTTGMDTTPEIRLFHQIYIRVMAAKKIWGNPFVAAYIRRESIAGRIGFKEAIAAGKELAAQGGFKSLADVSKAHEKLKRCKEKASTPRTVLSPGTTEIVNTITRLLASLDTNQQFSTATKILEITEIIIAANREMELDD